MIDYKMITWENVSSIIWSYLAHFLDSDLQMSSKRGLIFFPKKSPLWKNFLQFLKKYFLLFCEMELSYSFSKESFSYISGSENPKTFFIFWEVELSELKKKKKITPKKFLIFQEMKLYSFMTKKFLIFPKMGLSYIFLYFRQCNFLTPTLKKIVYFPKKTPKNS